MRTLLIITTIIAFLSCEKNTEETTPNQDGDYYTESFCEYPKTINIRQNGDFIVLDGILEIEIKNNKGTINLNGMDHNIELIDSETIYYQQYLELESVTVNCESSFKKK